MVNPTNFIGNTRFVTFANKSNKKFNYSHLRRTPSSSSHFKRQLVYIYFFLPSTAEYDCSMMQSFCNDNIEKMEKWWKVGKKSQNEKKKFKNLNFSSFLFTSESIP